MTKKKRELTRMKLCFEAMPKKQRRSKKNIHKQVEKKNENIEKENEEGKATCVKRN